MKKLLRKFFVGGVGAILVMACSVESVDDEMTTLNANASTMVVQDISMGDLVGRWDMYSMTSVATENHPAVAVDFDQKNGSTYDLLEETDCFDSMYFNFDLEGNVTTEQARLYFDSTSGQFTCATTGNYTAKYTIDGDQLEVTFHVNGVQYTQSKTISRYSENDIEYLKVTLTESETDGAVYVNEDPGNTVASDIKKIEMVYKKVQ